ncbi:hypothetical protein BH23PLA1_BH23PLA1_31440 [soil metagenome]
MKILDRLPILDRPRLVTVQGEAVDVYRNQILVWVSINNIERPLPAVLDTGHGHNFSITEKQLAKWSGATLRRIGELEIARERVVQHDAELHIHRNVPGSMERRGETYRLEVPQGISVIPEGHEAAPRLPLLGLRVLISNKLRLVSPGRPWRPTFFPWDWSESVSSAGGEYHGNLLNDRKAGGPTMPSPFPGMDPYLESPAIWPDFHEALATEIRSELNVALPNPYYARLGMRPELGIVDAERSGPRIVPDVAVAVDPRRQADGGVAVMERARAGLSPSIELSVQPGIQRHHFVEIRDPSQGHKLITLIEILSPSNKRKGPDRDAYEAKQREILNSEVSLIEIDLLRRGDRVYPHPDLKAMIERFQPLPTYLVLVNRSWRRGMERLDYQVFPVGLHEWLPCIPILLKPEEAEIPLDLQFVFQRVYDGGPYRRGAVDYSRPPDSPLPGQDSEWAMQQLRERGFLPTPPN